MRTFLFDYEEVTVMNRKLQRVAAAAVSVAMLTGTMAPGASAAGWGFGSFANSGYSIFGGNNSIRNWLTGLFGGSESTPSATPAPTAEPTAEPTAAPEENGSADSVETMLVEDESTVEPGTELRATTYQVTAPAAWSGTELKYFPVTLYDYDQETINNATHQLEVDNALSSGSISSLTQWNGVYFGDMSSKSDSYTYGSGSTSYDDEHVTYSRSGNYSSYVNNGYYYKTNGQFYLVTSLSCKRTYHWLGYYSYDWSIGYKKASDTKYDRSSSSSITLYKAKNQNTTRNLEYANHDWWTGNLNGSNGNRTYSGMVQQTLDSNMNIQFNYPDAGIFNSDSSVKEIYTNVGLPFVYDKDTGYYTFDANTTGAYFHNDASQGTSSTPASNSNLYFSSTPQHHDFKGQDGRTNGWFPFNDMNKLTNTETTANYYFGMNATIPFTMTANGRMNASDDKSDHIEFQFSGDDDVWVFIDGTLVLDIGGIRNGMNGTINFADNTWEITEMVNLPGKTASDINRKALSGKLFNEVSEDGTVTEYGALNMTRETFAATDEHQLTVYYLERGGGSSNCMIKFNLPVKDSVSVTKQITESKTSDDQTYPLTEAEKQMVNGVDFGFTLYKNDKPVGNATYVLQNENGQTIATPSTDRSGHFTLRNGQTAKFIGEINSDNYYVVEDSKEGYQNPEFTYSAKAANGSNQNAPQNGWTSMTVSVSGSEEAEDSLQFVCKNYLSADIANPSVYPSNDQVVLDYNLPVEIQVEDILKNDTWKGDKIEVTEVSGGSCGTAQLSDGVITYTLNKPLNDVDTLTYKVKVTSIGDNSQEATAEDTGTIYIIPATTMYYEENFDGLVSYTGNWTDEGTADNDVQETGLVGTTTSPYGSDPAYLQDSGDSNGTSKYVNTANGSAKFSYTFRGTGTSFFARTSKTSGYMKVVISDQNGGTLYTLMRDTSFKDDGSSTLYNIPVFTWNADTYGTYTVTVSIAGGAAAFNYGKDFWLDGIRVVNPMNPESDKIAVAGAAYAADGEENMTFVTLREKILNDYSVDAEGGLVWDGVNFVLFTDTNGEIEKASEYQSNGPKEEVYLAKGQSVTFSLNNWDANTNKVFLGMKAPMGSAQATINYRSVAVNNTPDSYYDISSYANIRDNVATFKITNNSDQVLSLTNIKVTGSAEFTIVDNGEIVPDEENGDVEVDGDQDITVESLDVAAMASAPVSTPAPTEEPAATEQPAATEEPAAAAPTAEPTQVPEATEEPAPTADTEPESQNSITAGEE